MARKAVQDRDFGARFSRLRTLLGVSQDALAAATGQTREVISNIERGVNKGTSGPLREDLAKGLGVNQQALADFWQDRITPEEFAGKVQLQKPPPPEVAPDLSDGGFRWQALLELIDHDHVDPAGAVQAVREVRPSAPRTFDYYTRAKRTLKVADVAVDPRLAGVAKKRR